MAFRIEKRLKRSFTRFRLKKKKQVIELRMEKKIRKRSFVIMALRIMVTDWGVKFW